MEQELPEARARRKAELEAQHQRRITDLKKERAMLLAELASLKGLFSGIRRNQIEKRLTEIEKIL